MDRFYSLCLQGDINAAMEYLNLVQPKTKENEKIQQRYMKRFFNGESVENILTEDSWIKDVIITYHSYFRTVLTNADMMNDAELHLNEGLRMHVKLESPLNIDETENELATIFTEMGYYFLGGVTPPFRSAYIWKNTETFNFNVEIPQQTITVSVNMMSDFLLEGWMGKRRWFVL